MTPFMSRWVDPVVRGETVLATWEWFHMLPLTLFFGFITRKR